MSTTSTTEPHVVAQQYRDAFVRNIRVIMARDGIKTRPLADRIGRPYAWVWHRVTGRTVPDLDDLAVFSEALGVPLTELVSLVEPTTTYIPGGVS